MCILNQINIFKYFLEIYNLGQSLTNVQFYIKRINTDNNIAKTMRFIFVFYYYQQLITVEPITTGMKHLLSVFFFASLFFSCTDMDESGRNTPDAQSLNSALGISANFIRLADDSTQTAGVLELTTHASELSVKWNVSPQFNLDTTVTILPVSEGKCQLPIKWAKKMEDGTYGPMGLAFSGGVLVKSGDESKYVRLIWADKIDSIKVAQSAAAMTRASETELPENTYIKITPILLELDKDTCGQVTVEYDTKLGSCFLFIDYLQTLVDWNRPCIDISSLPPTVDESPSVVQYQWEGGVAPEEGFMAHIEYNTGDFSTFSYFRYTVPTPAEFEYISNEPETTELLDATKAYVIVKVRTNKIWSLECDDSDIKTVKSAADATGTQMLVIQVSDNPDQSNRTIRVRVKSQGELVKELVYTQKPKSGTFNVLEVTPIPSEDLVLSSDPQDIKVKVETTVPWWIMVNGEKKEFGADKQEGIFRVPEYIGKDSRKLNVIIGYGDTQVEIYNYTQKAGDSVVYKTNNLANPIPLEGGTYTFTFEGLYAGDIQIRVLKSDSTILANGIPVTNLHPTVTVPNNYGSLTKRNVIFQYRLGTGTWADIEEANRPQTGATIDQQVLPSGSIPAEGGGYSCIFSGSYTGKVFLRATVEGIDSVYIGEGNCPGAASVKIPAYTGDGERKVIFDYSVDEVDWSYVDERMQYAQTIKFTPISPEGVIPATGGAYRSTFSGTYTGQITFRARLVDGTVLDSKRKILDLFELNIPANPVETEREIIFEYSRNGTDGWVEVERKFQSGKVKVDSDKPNVGDLEDGGNNNNEVEL